MLSKLENHSFHTLSNSLSINHNHYLSVVYSRFRAGKVLSDMFAIKNGFEQGDALSPLLLNFVLEYTIRRVRVD